MTITSVILTVSIQEARAGPKDGPAICYPAVEAVNEWLVRCGHGRLTEQANGNCEGQLFRAFLFLGAFEDLDLAATVAVIESAPWSAPELVQLFVMNSEDQEFGQRFRVVLLKPTSV